MKIDHVLLKLNEYGKENGFPYVLFALFQIFNYVFAYPAWVLLTHSWNYPFTSFHVFSLFFCIVLALKKYWPKKLEKFYTLYWYIVITWCLPASATFFYLHHTTYSALFLVNAIIVLFTLILIVDWISFIIVLFFGIFIGIMVEYLITGNIHVAKNELVNIITNFCWTIFVGVIFSRNASRHRLNFQLKKQLETIQTVCASIAHELRTPLRTIQSGANGFKKYLPQLLETYDIAKKENLPIPKINIMHQQALMSVLNNINTEILASFTFIDMLLTNVNENSIGKNLKVCSIEHSVQVALERYPFNDNEKKLVSVDIKHNFHFKGNEELMVHVLFNLLKNALYYLKEANKGEILIWTEESHKYNMLHFKDTGKGIDEKVLPHIFDRFFSRTYHGTGIGLAFCKLVMQSFGGDIRCHSVAGEYADFMMTFPKHINDG